MRLGEPSPASGSVSIGDLVEPPRASSRMRSIRADEEAQRPSANSQHPRIDPRIEGNDFGRSSVKSRDNWSWRSIFIYDSPAREADAFITSRAILGIISRPIKARPRNARLASNKTRASSRSVIYGRAAIVNRRARASVAPCAQEARPHCRPPPRSIPAESG